MRWERVITDGTPESAMLDPEGEAVIQYRYNTATVKLRSDLSNNVEGSATIAHEMLHVAQAPEFMAVDRIIGLLPKKLRRHAYELWHDGNEQTTERLARALTPILMPVSKRKRA